MLSIEVHQSVMRLNGEIVLIVVQSSRPGVVRLKLETMRKSLLDSRLQRVVIAAREVREVRDVLRPTESAEVGATLIFRNVAVRRQRCRAGW